MLLIHFSYLLLLGEATTSSASATPTLAPFSYGQEPVRGVNLGGWFVLEPWITPSIFESLNDSNIVDEYTLGQNIAPDVALPILQNHWATWITEDDFKAIAAAGLNHVRMQIGYWSVPITSTDTNYSTSTEPYIPGAWPYLLQGLTWAKQNGLHVILDLHGAPGSQNGYDNSGQRTSNPAWGSNSENVPRTLDIIKFIAEKLGGMIDILELLNEPVGFETSIGDVIGNYWKQGYQVVRQSAGTQLKVMIMDAFLGVDSWEDFLTYPSAQGVLMDTHEYQIFNYDQLELSQPEHITYSCQVMTNLSSFANSNIYTIIGEWTTAPTDCAQWLNGRGVGARWDGTWQSGQPTFGSCDGMTGNMSTFSDDYKTFLRQYYEAQVAIGEAIQGWVYWTWKAENADDWSYQRGLAGGWIPQNPSDRMYPDIC
ncbi:glycoside hydrolase family 5 protein [Phlebiopsis gigantea 11061_1 CR5-6]|uniref:Glycoside hydrolase family 5 protein n=1 Tax=Phlebiopsis gigantea (strain 11061_1 CR5-6) TaxID=745531 RepID=A0A0C3PN56_PHLG1|nr:glycoside hydrolase family 5 protein [Phlebiopsis gigantea 11061_1 CR5-6]